MPGAKQEQNQLKYQNYREQFKRLNKAITQNFYLEAVFIEYAVMEDRTESIIRHAGKWEAYLKKRGKYEPTLDSKIRYISSQMEANRKDLLRRYFNDGCLNRILTWKEERNRLIHALLKQKLTTEELASLAEQGRDIARQLSNKATNYNRAIEKKRAMETI